MRILAIETSTPAGSIALLDTSNQNLEVRGFESHRAHNAKIFAPLEELIRAHPGSLDLIVVGTGPGSYSGVRVGIAVANGFAMAHQCPAIGIPSILALDTGSETPPTDINVVGDARRGSYFFARIRDGKLIQTDDLVLNAKQFEAAISSSTVPIVTMDLNPPSLQAVVATPRASLLAHAVNALSQEKITEASTLPLQPLYLRAPYITKPRRLAKPMQRPKPSPEK